jgi:hypothetical protein
MVTARQVQPGITYSDSGELGGNLGIPDRL